MCENIESVPDWLNEHFLEKNLRNHFKNDEINVINFNVNVATAKEGRSVYRVTVSFGVSLVGEENCHLIVKEASSIADYLDASSKEISFYDEIVAKFNEKLDDVGEPELFPEVFGVCKEKNLITLGDLSAKGYQILPANRGFNIFEAKSILKRMAVFHAISAVLQEEDANIFANYKYGRLCRETNQIYAENLKVVTDVVSKWPNFAVYAEKLRRLYGEIIERAHQTYDVNPNHFNTLNHDSLCSEHLMVRTENSTEDSPIENTVFIGFQHSCWGSPTLDLHYFLNTSIDEAYRPQRFDELVLFYYEHLVNFLKQLKYKNRIPIWTEFQNQYHERNILGFIFSCLVEPFNDILVNNEVELKARRDFYKDETTQANLRNIILYYDQLGTFD
ncbi:uncharacterized protein LOC129568213 [Sitodiplosis mosellana]|uniref:uncharacterized protein LOC129568213 n=1 Tax=Sitodiplosis mosellana TaxID=263140 RepID=UPI0024444DB6|nr:uncharacterized protein LOC129568213 [Sitodiplosis mosellana]